MQSVNPQHDQYRLALVSASSKKLNVEVSGSVTRLPTVSISRRTRPAEEIQSAIRERWGIQNIVLDVLSDGPLCGGLAIVEVTGHASPDNRKQVLNESILDDISGSDLSDFERSMLDRLLRTGEAGRGPFSRLGWVEEAIAWVSTSTSTDRATLRTCVKQFNASGTFALVRFGEEEGPRYWLKAVGAPNLHEYSVHKALSRIMPEYIPPLLSTRDDWNAWLMEDTGRPLDEMTSADNYGRAIASLARMQQASIGHVDSLLSAGCADQRNLRNEIPEMMVYLREAMARQTSTKVAKLSAGRLDEIGEILACACDEMEDIGIPFTLIHNDINPGNILIQNDSCLFTDWAEAAIGYPFVTFEQMRVQASQQHNSREFVREVRGHYGREWEGILGSDKTTRALILTPLIAIASYLYGRGDSFASEWRRKPRIESYSRALARHMDRIARELECAEVICS
jgi:hypothetical protein